MTPTEKDLITEILFNKKYNWDFAFEKEPVPRPDGVPIFVSMQHPREGIYSRITILDTGKKLYLVCQIQIPKYKDKNLIDYNKLIENQRKFPNNSSTLDLNNPFYNIEWAFQITEDYWKTLKKKLKEISIPVCPVISKYSEINRRIFYIRNDDGNYTWFRWECNDDVMKPVAKIMDDMLNFSLEKVEQAYYSGGVRPEG